MIFAQVCSSVKNGENQTSSVKKIIIIIIIKIINYFKSQDLALLVAYQYLLENEGLEPTDKRLSLHCNHVMPANIYKAQKSYKKEWIRMVSKTLAELKKEDPSEIGQDQVIEKVRKEFLVIHSYLSLSRLFAIR